MTNYKKSTFNDGDDVNSHHFWQHDFRAKIRQQ